MVDKNLQGVGQPMPVQRNLAHRHLRPAAKEYRRRSATARQRVEMYGKPAPNGADTPYPMVLATRTVALRVWRAR
jgi:hypothetical protein